MIGTPSRRDCFEPRDRYFGGSHLPFSTGGEKSKWKYRQPFESFQPRIPANADFDGHLHRHQTRGELSLVSHQLDLQLSGVVKARSVPTTSWFAHTYGSSVRKALYKTLVSSLTD